MTSPYLKRPIRTLEQALWDRARAQAGANAVASISLAVPGTSLVPVETMARMLTYVIAGPTLAVRPTQRTAPDREAA